MSRILMAAASRLPRDYLRPNRLNCLLHITRDLAAKKASKCDAKSETKPKWGHFPSGGTHAVFSDLPMPEGDFYKAWHAKNKKYNMILISGILALVGSIFAAVSSGKMPMNYFVPDYPYTEDEMDKFAKEEERRQLEKLDREQIHQDMVDAKELKIRRRKAKEVMPREVELMQKDINEGLSDQEMSEMTKLQQEREEFEAWEKEEMKRIEEKQQENEKIKQEKLKELQEEQEKKKEERRK